MEQSPSENRKHGCFVMSTFSLEQFLQACAGEEPHQLEQGWTAFFRQYKLYLYKVIHNTAARRSIHLSQDAVNEILFAVIAALCERGYRLLKQFRAVDNELSFRAFLATIAARTTERHLSESKTTSLDELAQEPEMADSSPQASIQLFEQVVRFFRDTASPKEKNIEFKILMFNVYVLGDFSAEMLSCHPLFKNMGARVLDNVINRMRAKLVKNLQIN